MKKRRTKGAAESDDLANDESPVSIYRDLIGTDTTDSLAINRRNSGTKETV